MHDKNGTNSAKDADFFKQYTRPLLLAVAVIVVLVVAGFSGRILGSYSRRMAAHHIDLWALGDAMVWLNRADQIDPRNVDTELLRAACLRNLGETRRCRKALDLAKRYGASTRDLEIELELSQIQLGEFAEDARSAVEELIREGHSPEDARAALLQGLVAQSKSDEAATLLRTWLSDEPQHPHYLYLQAILYEQAGDADNAAAWCKRVLAIEPRHELAKHALARQYNVVHRPDQALDLYLSLANHRPDSEAIVIGLARTLRKLGRLRDARIVLAPLSTSARDVSDLAVEMGHIEMGTGHYETALTWFNKVEARDIAHPVTLYAAGIALAAIGDTFSAGHALLWVDEATRLIFVLADLESRMAIDPGNRLAGAEYQALQQSFTAHNSTNPYKLALAKSAGEKRESPKRRHLYDRHCRACHGSDGDGRGFAARFLFPQPRDLRGEPARLVSTQNGIPTRDDTRAVIKNGIPGTSMTSLDTLTDSEIDQLVGVVVEMRHDGVRDNYLALLNEDGAPIDAQEVESFVTENTAPGALLTVPDVGARDPEIIRQGKSLFRQQACHSCHGDTGASVETTPLYDDRGRPSFPRDLVFDWFKGGNTAESVYLRLVLGMPGTAHPANVSMSESELIALVQYCQSLGQAPKRNLTNYQRAIRASRP